MNEERENISAHAQRPRDPVVIARLALTKLARMAIAPTPENYASEYMRAAGLTPHDGGGESQAEKLAAESAALLLRLVESIGQTTTGLAIDIERFDGDLKTVFDEVDQLPPDGVRGLLRGLTSSGLALQKTVEASRCELDATRKRLHEVSAELERSRAQARIDPLTGSFNRRGMEEIARREIARARRAKSPLSLAILDIDHFKRINDEHGHDVGDQALIHLVSVVKAGLRETDVVCRYGGEEFVAILPDTGLQRAFFVIDRLRMIVEESPLMTAGGAIRIHFSAGVAELSGNEEHESLVKRADAALYAAKRAGRNRLLMAESAAAA